MALQSMGTPRWPFHDENRGRSGWTAGETGANSTAAKWTRYGYYDEQGNLTMTRVL